MSYSIEAENSAAVGDSAEPRRGAPADCIGAASRSQHPDDAGLDAKGVDLGEFIDRVWQMGRLHERGGLPWRGIDDAYGVYVSEAMLQQTQVARVMSYWPRWMSVFPTIDALSAASTPDVLEMWQGLGYNRRALNMKRTADICSQQLGGRLPDTVEGLLALPGIGPATAAGIVAFAYQRPSVYIETNVRAVFIHEFFADAEGKVPDRDIEPLVRATCSAQDPRGWYYALLDYGAHLKATQPNPTRKAAAYTRQSRFEGSHRQKRSFLLREVLGSEGVDLAELKMALDDYEMQSGRGELAQEQFDALVAELVDEGFLHRKGALLLP